MKGTLKSPKQAREDIVGKYPHKIFTLEIFTDGNDFCAYSEDMRYIGQTGNSLPNVIKKALKSFLPYAETENDEN